MRQLAPHPFIHFDFHPLNNRPSSYLSDKEQSLPIHNPNIKPSWSSEKKKEKNKDQDP